ncbi:MAG: LysR family transcriptional regulator [Spirochaetales bacterium]|nr:LysR family transcriptional regulator [Spirochaetales bacterium]
MINLEWFRTFKTVFEKGNMTSAAESLYISQPGVSLHLSSLENHIGFKLFDRLPRKLVPTERAKLLYNSIIDPLLKLEEAEQTFQKNNDEDRPTLTIGMCFETFQLILEKHIPHIPANLILEFDEYRKLLEKLEQGLIDLVVTPRKIEKRDVTYTAFSQENILIVAGKDTDTGGFYKAQETGNPSQVLDWLMQQKWYGITGDNEHLKRFWKRNFDEHPAFRPNYIVPNIHSIIRCLSHSSGLAVIPDFLCLEQIKEGVLQPLWKGHTPLNNTLYFARNKQELHPDLINLIENIIRDEMP